MLTHVRPNAVVEERTCADRSDINEQYVSALKHCANITEDRSEPGHGMPSYDVTTGNAMIDQLEPNFFGKAFPFCFPFCLGMPNYGKERGDAPRRATTLGLRDWCKSIARRVEAQCGRDWLLGFAMMNYIFRTNICSTRSFHLALPKSSDITTQQMEKCY